MSTPESANVPENSLDMDAVVGILRTKHGLETAHVQHTGGGVMVLYAGPTRPDYDNDPQRDVLYAAIAGPGFFEESHGDRGASYFDLAELLIGADDQGDSTPLDAVEVGATTAEQVAALIAAQARLDDPSKPIAEDAARALLG